MLHPIAEEPATDPPVPSLVVCSDKWTNWHLIYWEEVDLCQDESPEDYYDNEQYPPPSAEITITARDKGFVTVHNYVTQLHPWLFIHQDMIIRAEGPDNPPFDKEFMIDTTYIGEFDRQEPSRWLDLRRRAAKQAHKRTENK